MSLRIREKAPEWEANALMPYGTFKKLKSNMFYGKTDEYRGVVKNNNYTVLFFYPLDWTFVCPTEIVAFSESIEKFKKLNCNVLGCSVDSEYSHLAWVEKERNKGGIGKINIPLLADIKKDIARDFNVLSDDGVAFRGLFIIDPSGIIRHISINDLPVGRNIDEVLRLVEAFKHTDKHGTACPINWTSGGKTIEPDPVGSLEYFSEL